LPEPFAQPADGHHLRRLLFSSLLGLALLAGSVPSRAADAKAAAPSAPGAAGPAEDAADDDDDDADGRFQASMDWIVSTVHVPIVAITPGATPSDPPTRTEEDARVFVRNVTASVGYKFTPHLRAGLLLPWTASTITVGDRTSRGATSFGNLELDGFYEHSPFPHATLVYAIGTSGVSAQGSSGSASDQAASDQDATNRAVTAAGGRLESARFSPGHYAFIASVAFSYRRHGWSLEHYLRTEDIRDQAAQSQQRDTLKNESGLRFARRFGRFEPGLRGWIDWIPIGPRLGDRQIASAVAPDVRARFGPVTTTLALILPLVGPQTSPRIVSGQLTLALDL
jgi:hypothetical protein